MSDKSGEHRSSKVTRRGLLETGATAAAALVSQAFIQKALAAFPTEESTENSPRISERQLAEDRRQFERFIQNFFQDGANSFMLYMCVEEKYHLALISRLFSVASQIKQEGQFGSIIDALSDEQILPRMNRVVAAGEISILMPQRDLIFKQLLQNLVEAARSYR